MSLERLGQELAIEFGDMEATVRDLESLRRDLAAQEPTVREKAAAAAFLADFYAGVENILKRISQFHGVGLPAGETWHLELFRQFCDPPLPPLPALLDQQLVGLLTPYRKFRHVFHHGYSFRLEWARMLEGVETAPATFARFRESVRDYLAALEETEWPE